MIACDPASLAKAASCYCFPENLQRGAWVYLLCQWANKGGGPSCTLPTAPVDLGASAGNAQVTLTWPVGVGATGYNIKRALVPGGPYTVIGTSASSPYVDLTAVNGTAYYYVVSSTNACGESAGNSIESHATPEPPVPVNTVLPVITGTAQVGQTLSGSDGTWTNTPTIFTYRWLANGVEIGGATANTFLLTSAQLGAVITFEVTAYNTGGSGTPTTSAATDAVIAAPLTDSFDDMESYTVAGDVNGLNGGTGWLGAYADNFPGIGLGEVDDMESYTIAAALDGLNGGTAYHQFWGGPYVDR